MKEPLFLLATILFGQIAVAVQANTSVGQNLGKPFGRMLVEILETISTRPPVPSHVRS